MGHKSDAPLEEPHALTTPTEEEGLGGLVLALLRGEYMWSLAASDGNLTANYEQRNVPVTSFQTGNRRKIVHKSQKSAAQL